MTQSAPARVLVLDGQTNQALATTRSLGRAGHTVFVASLWTRPLAYWSRHCAGATRLAADTPEEYSALRAWAHDQGIEVVLPMTERSCLLCSLERASWTEAGIAVGCAETELLMRAFDKGATLQFAAGRAVRIPTTLAPASLAEAVDAADAVGFPCVVKARFSHPWVDGRFLADLGCGYAKTPQELEAAVLARRQGDLWPLVQQYVPGTGKGVFALCDRGRPLAWFAHERVRDVRPSGSGSSVRRSVALDPRLVDPAERLLRALEWHGPAMVEFRDDPGEEPCLMEVNGRFWNSLQLAIAAGVDFPRLWLAILRGERVDGPPVYQDGVTVRWLWGDVKRLLYILGGPPAGFAGVYPSRWQGLRDLLGPQSPGCQVEIWQRSDPWPALGEWTQAAREIWAQAVPR